MQSRRIERLIGIAATAAVITGLFTCGGCGQLGLGNLGGLFSRTISEDKAREAWARWIELRATIDEMASTVSNTLFAVAGDAPDSPMPIPVTNAIPDQRAAFLFDGAATRAMNVAALSATPESVAAIIKRQIDAGANTAWIYAYNSGDGTPVPTTFYKEEYGGEVDAARVQQIRNVLTMHREAGMRIVLWLTADDSDCSRATLEQHLSHARNCVELLGDLADEICVGLEMDSDGRKAYAARMIAECKRVAGGKRVGVHLNSDQWELAVAWGADVLYYQFGWQTDPTAAALEFAGVVKSVAGRCAVVAAEYHKSSDSDQARTIGAAISAVPGCAGTGNGRL